MRLKRLDITRYGKFTDHSIDFGDKETARPDLHVVYGPNEAGKSTLFAAFLDLLFGIETRKKGAYNFLHPYPTMRIGAALEFRGCVQDFVRLKRQQNSLLDGCDQPVGEAAVSGELGGLDRRTYGDMFSLNDETLEAGGESILASKGDLGQLLFSASAGLADLSTGLGAVRTEAELYFKTSHSGMLAELKKKLETLKNERAAIDTRASDYARLLKLRDEAAGLYDGTLAGRRSIDARLKDIQRHLAALPRLEALRRIRDRLAPLAGLPETPRHWITDLPGLQREEVELGVHAKAAAAEIDDLQDLIASIGVDEVALRHVDEIVALEEPRSRFIAAKDLPNRRQKLRDAEAVIADVLRRIEREGETQPRRLILGVSVTGRLRHLIETRSGIDAAMTTAWGELTEARRRAGEARDSLGSTADGAEAGPGRDAVMAALAAILTRLRSDDHQTRRKLADRACGKHRATLSDRLSELRPWQGNVDDLLDRSVPEADRIARWTASLGEAQKTIDLQTAEVQRWAGERRRSEAERDAIGTTTGLLTDQETAAIRTRRDLAWSDHRQRLDTTSADLFEVALRLNDGVSATRFAHFMDLARLRQASQACDIAKAGEAHAAELRNAASAKLRGVEADIAEAIREVSLALDGMTLRHFETWLARRDKLREVRHLLREAAQDREDAERDAAAARRTLAGALDRAGLQRAPDADFETLSATAQAAIDREAELKVLRGAAAQREREVETRQEQAERAAAGERTWDDAWAKACVSCWLAEGSTIPTMATVRELLPALDLLAAALKERDDFAYRIGAMERDQSTFRETIAAIAAAMGMAEAADDTMALSRTIDERVRLARSGRVRHDAEMIKLERARERRRKIDTDLDIHRGQATQMTTLFGVETLAEVVSKSVLMAKRDDLKRQAEETEREVIEALRVATLAEAEAALGAVDREALELEMGELETRCGDMVQRCQEYFLKKSNAEEAVVAVGGDSKVAEIEERRRTTQLEIEEGALRYLKLRIGAAATEQALRAYRDRHRSSMMARASEAFRTISQGAYSSLSAQPKEGGGETLIAVQAGGGSKQASDLSKGTRFQLYLALRVAGYHEFAKSRPPVPFVADDIMETFDDFRAEEAFRLFAGMAEVGQVIYLTHHRHLCDIARSVCPGTRVHDIAVG